MRVRSNSQEPYAQSLHVLSTRVSPYQVTDFGHVRWRQRDHHGLMYDEPLRGKKVFVNGHGFRWFKPCSHDRYSVLAQGTPMEVWTDANYHVTQSVPELLRAWYGVNDLFITTDWVYNRATATCAPENSRHYERWLAVKPTMETRASLAVFLYELREISQFWNILPKKHLRSRSGAVKNWRDVLKYANSSHLFYNFGFKPFLRDVKNVFRGLDSFDQRYTRYLRDMDKNLIRRYRDAPLLEEINNEYPFPGNSFYTVVEKGPRETQFASAFEYYYSSPYAGRTGSEWRMLADTLGLNLNPSTIWAVIPWSFVGDWFYDISGLLKSNESDWMQTAINMLQASYSRHVTGYFKYALRGAYGGVTLPEIKIEYSQYRRYLGWPSFSGIQPTLDADKIRLGASLMYGRPYKAL